MTARLSFEAASRHQLFVLLLAIIIRMFQHICTFIIFRHSSIAIIPSPCSSCLILYKDWQLSTPRFSPSYYGFSAQASLPPTCKLAFLLFSFQSSSLPNLSVRPPPVSITSGSPRNCQWGPGWQANHVLAHPLLYHSVIVLLCPSVLVQNYMKPGVS